MYNNLVGVLRFFTSLYAGADNRVRFPGDNHEVSVFIDLGGAVWFFLFVSHLPVPDAGQLSPEAICSRRMDRDCAGNYRISYQHQHGTFLPAVHAQRN